MHRRTVAKHSAMKTAEQEDAAYERWRERHVDGQAERPSYVVCPALRARLGRAVTAKAPAAGATEREVVDAEVVFSALC